MPDNQALQIASVLIIDDSPVQRAHAVSVCRALGVGLVHTAGNGSEAIALLSTLAVPPDF
jgi:CheY-like chemotaxis protein